MRHWGDEQALRPYVITALILTITAYAHVSDLETRVLSLFATDYLLNPEAYEDDLSVCPCCDRVSFDAFGQCPRCSSAESGLRRLDSILDEEEREASVPLRLVAR